MKTKLQSHPAPPKRIPFWSLLAPGLLISLSACSQLIDPYDPPMGGRNPRPGAERHLDSRNDISPPERIALLDRKPCSPVLLAKLAEAPSREVRSLVAANPSASAATLEKLLDDKEPGVRGYIATNPRAPHDILIKLKNDPDYNVRWILPGNSNWHPDELHAMYHQMRTEASSYRQTFTSPSVFAGNPSTPPDILLELSKDDSYFVQSALANNPSIPPSAAETLATRGNPSIKTALTRNKATPIAVLKKLAADPDADVSSAAKARLGN